MKSQKRKLQLGLTENSKGVSFDGISLQEICRLLQREEEEDSRAAYLWKNNSEIDQTLRMNVKSICINIQYNRTNGETLLFSAGFKKFSREMR